MIIEAILISFAGLFAFYAYLTWKEKVQLKRLKEEYKKENDKSGKPGTGIEERVVADLSREQPVKRTNQLKRRELLPVADVADSGSNEPEPNNPESNSSESFFKRVFRRKQKATGEL